MQPWTFQHQARQIIMEVNMVWFLHLHLDKHRL